MHSSIPIFLDSVLTAFLYGSQQFPLIGFLSAKVLEGQALLEFSDTDLPASE